jgi:5-methylcytosine-specific restriction endonuclease McrA
MKNGVIDANMSRDLHHIVKIVDNRELRMDSTNWLALCRECHQEIEGNTEVGFQIKQWSLANYNEVIDGRS